MSGNLFNTSLLIKINDLFAPTIPCILQAATQEHFLVSNFHGLKNK